MKKDYLKPTTEVVTVHIERILGAVSDWSTDSGGNKEGINKGTDPSLPYRPNRSSSSAPLWSDDEESDY